MNMKCLLTNYSSSECRLHITLDCARCDMSLGYHSPSWTVMESLQGAGMVHARCREKGGPSLFGCLLYVAWW